jgi:hypothetical protein
MSVFVLDKQKKPLMPCTEKRARLLLERKRAVIHKLEPFTIRLKDRTVQNSHLQSVRLKLDPGSKTTGTALVSEQKVLFLGELHHKLGIKDALESRRQLRSTRRNRKIRYRAPRFLNRTRKKGWLPPSLQARMEQSHHLVMKFKQLVPVTNITMELVKFDTQKMINPEISGIEYQQGELVGYEIREYLLEKFNRMCAYCSLINIPLEVEHVHPKSLGGSNRISNLTIACHDCNQEKGSLTLDEWMDNLLKSKRSKDKIRLLNIPKVKKQLLKPLKDVASVNATRWALYDTLKNHEVPLETGSGALTKMQRIALGFRKEHYFDALCAGYTTPKSFNNIPVYASEWFAKGRGRRQVRAVDKFGFPFGEPKKEKQAFGFFTGDIVIANVLKGKKMGHYRGRIAIRETGYFNIKDIYTNKLIQGISYKSLKILQRNDGWFYTKKKIS